MNDLARYQQASYGGPERREIERSYGLSGYLPDDVSAVMAGMANGKKFADAFSTAMAPRRYGRSR